MRDRIPPKGMFSWSRYVTSFNLWKI